MSASSSSHKRTRDDDAYDDDDSKKRHQRAAELYQQITDQYIATRCLNSDSNHEEEETNRIKRCGSCDGAISGDAPDIRCYNCFMIYYCSENCRQHSSRHRFECVGEMFVKAKNIAYTLVDHEFGKDKPIRQTRWKESQRLLWTRDLVACPTTRNPMLRECAECKNAIDIGRYTMCVGCRAMRYCSEACTKADARTHYGVCSRVYGKPVAPSTCSSCSKVIKDEDDDHYFCAACRSVKYCNNNCMEAHRIVHHAQCSRRHGKPRPLVYDCIIDAKTRTRASVPVAKKKPTKAKKTR
jgi:hypothetical protein